MSNAVHLSPGALDLRILRHRIAGSLFTADDADWDSARSAWNLLDQQPLAVAFPESAEDVVTLVHFARRNGLRVAPQATGHGAMPNMLDDTILIKTTRMRGISIDHQARRARVEAGVEWQEVGAAAAEHGLVALHGSSPDVGVVGYTLGGGIGWLARSHGLAANSVTAIELVTPDGMLRRVDRENDPDLFWALRGGGGNFGVVTAIEFRLYPLTEIYAGWLWWPIDRAGDVLQAWRRWTAEAPDEATSSARLLQFPPLPQFPEEVRGKSFVVVEAAVQLDLDGATELLAPLRALDPIMDTFAVQPATALSTLHQDPEKASPGGRSDSLLLDSLDEAAIDAFVALGTGSPFISLELRHLGGELARPRAEHGALASIDAEYLLFAVGSASTFDAPFARLRRALEPWDAKRRYYNFGGSSEDSFWSETAEARLRRVKAKYDGSALVQANRVIPTDE